MEAMAESGVALLTDDFLYWRTGSKLGVTWCAGGSVPARLCRVTRTIIVRSSSTRNDQREV